MERIFHHRHRGDGRQGLRAGQPVHRRFLAPHGIELGNLHEGRDRIFSRGHQVDGVRIAFDQAQVLLTKFFEVGQALLLAAQRNHAGQGIRNAAIDRQLSLELGFQVVVIALRRRGAGNQARIETGDQKIGRNPRPITVRIPSAFEQILGFQRLISADHTLLFKIKQRLWTVAQNIGLHPTGAEFLLDSRRLATELK